MRSKLKKVLIFLVFPLVCIFAFAGCTNSFVLDVLERHKIDTDLLNDYEIVCDIKGDTFTGRAPTYGVMVFENEPTAFLQSFSTDKSSDFSSVKNEELEDCIDADLGNHSCMEIPREHYPDWHEKYTWFVSDRIGDLDTLYLIYFSDTFKLVVFETGH